ncbi:inner membrane protein YbjM [Pantoea sp.]|uniref:inner membrane protein YbjM n=1 Tax=Pantoea sp. TaxID=69393 RepID=UPI00289CED2B|nr:inner membrane protein YbjM [Pantoea sp.]
MSQRGKRWSALITGVLLYSTVFIYAHHAWTASHQHMRGEPELLLFLLPGVLMALLQPESPLKSTLVMALIVTLPAVLLLSDWMPLRHSVVLLCAWSLSALFWAGCGALLVRLIRLLWFPRLE